ncbi:MAG: ABC transporter substrate-binding protein [Desulfobacterales bacterium]|jgi:ABC-type branched-subunit amino acid transport system substrate-binding protein
MNKKLLGIGLLLVIILAIPSMAAAGPKVTGVTDTEVVVGLTTPLSGPAALWGSTGLGAKAWADHINAQGGIHGRKIKVILKDDGYNPARALANLQEMKGKIFAVCGLLGTAVVHTTRDFFPENKVLLINAYGNTRMWLEWPKDKLRYVFIAYPDYEDEGEWLADFAVEWQGSKKLAVFYQNDDYGKLGMAGVKKALARLSAKAKLTAAIPYEVTDRTVSTHALKLKQSGADTLILYPSPTHGANIIKETAKVGYRPKIITSFPLGDPILYKLCGELWEGVYPALPAHLGAIGSDPKTNRALDQIKKINSKIPSDNFAVFGAASMMHLVEGLRRAGRNLTADSMIKAMESIKRWQTPAGGAVVTYGPNRHHGLNGSRLARAQNGKHQPITDFIIYPPRF